MKQKQARAKTIMTRSSTIQDCIDTVIRKTNLTPLEPNSSHEQVIQYCATEGGSKAAVKALRGMLADALADEAHSV